jgi:hypothetical protein
MQLDTESDFASSLHSAGGGALKTETQTRTFCDVIPRYERQSRRLERNSSRLTRNVVSPQGESS